MDEGRGVDGTTVGRGGTVRAMAAKRTGGRSASHKPRKSAGASRTGKKKKKKPATRKKTARKRATVRASGGGRAQVRKKAAKKKGKPKKTSSKKKPIRKKSAGKPAKRKAAASRKKTAGRKTTRKKASPRKKAAGKKASRKKASARRKPARKPARTARKKAASRKASSRKKTAARKKAKTGKAARKGSPRSRKQAARKPARKKAPARRKAARKKAGRKKAARRGRGRRKVIPSMFAARPAPPPPPPASQMANKALVLFERGMRQFHRKNYENAETHFQRLTETYPQERELVARVQVFLQLCEQHLEGQDRKYKDPHDHYLRGVILSNRGEYEKAIGHLESALQMVRRRKKPSIQEDQIQYVLASTYALARRGDQALESLENAVRLNPRNRILAVNSPDFDVLRKDERFRNLLLAGGERE